jgi:predicted ATPase/Tfp pilus assembly protein PilF
MSVRGISDLERGRNRYPYRATVLRLIEVLEPDADAVEMLWALASRRRGATETAPAETQVRLPHPLTTILGREYELDHVLHVLRWDGARLVTLTGPGGVGKTRLALEVARAAAGDYADGATFVSLAAVTDPALVPSAIVAALGLDTAGMSGPAETLRAHLREREHLLVLDNFEQILDAGVFVVDLLWACPRVKVLVSSRAPLQVRGEHQIALPPLALPAPAGELTRDDLLAAPATRLFLERAAAANPALEMGPEEAQAVEAMCRRLDGLPLAIELAAAQVRYLPPHVLVTQLEEGTGALAPGSRDLPPRQQTLRATLDWSYRLLSPDAQASFRALSVFAGGATMEAAGVICAREDGAALPLLQALHDASLLEFDTPNGEGPHVRILETIRRYARERLEEDDDAETYRQRHAVYFAALAERAGPQLTGPEAPAWLGRLRTELANLRAALEWAQESAGIELGLRLAAPIWRFWFMTGQIGEGRRRLTDLLGSESATGVPDAIRADALQATASLMIVDGDPLPAREMFQGAFELWQSLGDVTGMATSANGLGVAASNLGEYREAERWLEESVRLRTEAGDRLGLHAPLSNLAAIARYRGDYPHAIELYRQALALQQQMGQARGTSNTLSNIAQLLGSQGEYEQAQPLIEEALALARSDGGSSTLADILHTQAAHELEQGHLAEAEQVLAESLELCRTIGDTGNEDYALINLAEFAIARGDAGRAADLAGTALTHLRQSGFRRGQAFALLALGEAARMRGEYDLAAAHIGECVEIRRELEDPLGIIDTVEARARLASSRGQPAEAAQLYGSAAALRARFGTPLPPVWQCRHEEDLDALRQSLGEETLSGLWKQGEDETASYLPVELAK